MIKIMRQRVRKNKNVCEDRTNGEPFQKGDENNVLSNIFEKIFQNILANSEKRLLW